MSIRKKILAGVCAMIFLALNVTVNGQIFGTPKASAATLSFNNLKGVDVMKYTKDTMTNQPSDATIQNLVNTLKTLGVTHIAVSVPMDPDSDYPGNKPSPRTSTQLVQKWADTIHGAGLNVIWRGTWAGIEGIYGFPKRVGSNRFPAGTAASASTDGNSTWLGKTYQYIINNPNFFKDGDVWAPLPERTEGIFSDSTAFLPSTGPGLQANFVNFFNDMKTISDQAFARIGKNMITGMTANNYSEVKSTWLPQSLFDYNGIVAIDYYGMNHSASEMESDLRGMAAAKGKPILLQEWGDYWNDGMAQNLRAQYLTGIYAVLEKLAREGILVGFNYWGGWDNSAEGLLTRNADGTFSLNYRGNLLRDFYAKFPSSGTIPVPPTPTPNPTLTCPAPATNAFSGCYYSDQNLTNLVHTQTDTNINFNWGSNSPASNLPSDHFSTRWQGNFNFNQGDYTFKVTADDGVRVYVDGNLILDKWFDQGATTYSIVKTMSTGSHLIKVEYYENSGGSVAQVSWAQNQTEPGSIIPPTQPATCTAVGNNAFTGCYYSDQNLTNLAFVRTDSNINFDWGSNSPDQRLPGDRFSTKWQGNFNFSQGDYTFTVTGDDGVRLYIDDQLVINQWKDQSATPYSVTKTLSAGTHLIKMEYYEAGGGAVAKLAWKSSLPVGIYTAQYFSDMTLGKLALSRTDSSINFNWGTSSPDQVVPVDRFSARWQGQFNFSTANPTFTVVADDGVRLYVDGNLVLDKWINQPATTYTRTVNLPAGLHTIKMEYYENGGGAVARLSWR